MGSEFMPPLNEGSLLFMPVLLPDVSLSEVKRIMAWQDQVIKQTPEVESVAGKLGRAETATDPAPVQMIETTIMLKPKSEWRPGLTEDQIVTETRRKTFQRARLHPRIFAADPKPDSDDQHRHPRAGGHQNSR